MAHKPKIKKVNRAVFWAVLGERAMYGQVADRVTRAAEYFRSKYGRTPTLCLLPKDEPEIPGNIGGVSCRADSATLHSHLYMGAE